jgi:hypothetical protein
LPSRQGGCLHPSRGGGHHAKHDHTARHRRCAHRARGRESRGPAAGGVRPDRIERDEGDEDKAAKSKATKKKTAGKAGKTTAAKAPKKSAPVSNAAGASQTTKPGPWKPNNPIAQELSSKPTEITRARRVLPTGTDLNAATAGFRNYSQFAAAINATESKASTSGS